MGSYTTIPWVRGADGGQGATWNPWVGCSGCRHDAICYRHRWFKRAGRDPYKIERAGDHTFRLPLRLPAGTPVFVCSLGDFFHEAADEWRREAWGIMERAHGVGPWIIPTSRPERIAACIPREGITADWQERGWRNVWFLASVADQRDADELLPHLLKVPVGHLGVSHEPATGVVDWARCIPCGYYCDERVGHVDHGPNAPLGRLEWLICGGANHTADPAWRMPLEAARADRDQAAAAGVPFFFKGHGAWIRGDQVTVDGALSLPDDEYKGFLKTGMADAYYRFGRFGIGAELDGRRHEALPWGKENA